MTAYFLYNEVCLLTWVCGQRGKLQYLLQISFNILTIKNTIDSPTCHLVAIGLMPVYGIYSQYI